MEEIKMKTPEGEEVMIDEAMAPIIYLFWSKGLRTKFCCAGHSNGACERFQSYIVFTLDSAPKLYDSLDFVLNKSSENDRKFICDHFNISFDMYQKSILVEAIASTMKSWVIIMATFYKIAENIYPFKFKMDIKYLHNWTWILKNKCVSINGECDEESYEDIYPHIRFDFFIIDDIETEEEIYFSIDKSYVYSTCFDYDSVDDKDDIVKCTPTIKKSHNIDINDEFIHIIEKPILRTDFIKLFGFDPLDQSE